MTIRDIQHHLASTLGTDLSHETISNVTDAVLETATGTAAGQAITGLVASAVVLL